MDRKYKDPEMEVSLFDCEDVITASGFEGEEAPLPGLTPVN